jgi:hypothetical protein
MNDILEPDWIKRRREQTTLAEAKADAARQRAIVFSLRIKLEGLKFWRQLLMELMANINALPGIGARGQLSTFGESSCRVDVEQKGSILGTTYTDLFFTPGKPSIECRTLEGNTSDFAFCILPDDQLGVAHEFNHLNTAEMAVMIVQQCVKRLGAEES